MATKRIRVRRRDRKRLKILASIPEVQEACETEDPTYEDLLREVLPEADEDTVIERPEEDMVWVSNIDEGYDKAHELAGENISAHHVINEYLDEFVEEHDIDLGSVVEEQELDIDLEELDE